MNLNLGWLKWFLMSFFLCNQYGLALSSSQWSTFSAQKEADLQLMQWVKVVQWKNDLDAVVKEN